MTGVWKFPVLLLACLLTACAAATPTPAGPRPTASPTLTPTETPTPTPTLTPEPTFTPTPLPHSDLQPIFSQDLSGKFQGIQINSQLITDISANDEASKISLESPGAGAVMAEFWVRTVYKVWLQKGGPDGTGPDPDVNFGLENFWKMWRTAQQTGRQADWEQVQITIYAHDLANPRYEQAPLKFWIGYMGGDPAPAGTVAIRQIELGVVTASVPNVTPWGVFGAGLGTNYLGETLLMYVCKFEKPYNRYSDTDISALIADISKWWLGNQGQDFATLKAGYDYDFINILKRGGFKVTPP